MNNTVRINIFATANVIKEAIGPEAFGFLHWDRVDALKEAFPDGIALIFREGEGTHCAVSPLDESWWYRGLPARCFGIGTDLSFAPSFDEWCGL